MCALRAAVLALTLGASGCWTNACIEQTAMGTARCWEEMEWIWDYEDYPDDPTGEYQRDYCMKATTCEKEGYAYACDDGYWHWDPCDQQ